ncbi:MAG: MarR family transcriptional regulator [Oscillochloris sp.]|nr:MarR family transcriptional regulator [Oscillochloris sp.]
MQNGRERQLAVQCWLRLARVYQQIDSDSAQRFRSHKLSTAQFDVLVQIGSHAGITQQELAESLLVTKGNISQLIGRMERDGLVARRHEGRRNCLELTAAGRSLYDAVVPEQEAAIDTIFDPLQPDERRILLDLLRRIDRSRRR